VARLIDEFLSQVDAKSARGLPAAGVRQAMDRFGWTARDVADRFGVSDRTARRWRQQDRIPERRREAWTRETRDAARARTRQRIERRGIGSMTATGPYRVSENRYKATPSSPVRIMPGNKITPAQMRDVFGAVDSGDMDAADQLLNDALAGAYEAPGLAMEDIDSLEWGI
jgi:hypothetical protein